MNKVNSKTTVWVESWKETISNFQSNKFGVNLYSPHILVEDIIIEIENNHFRNKENRNFFEKKIGVFLKKDAIIKELLFFEFEYLKRNFQSGNKVLILNIAYNIKKIFESGQYFKKSLNNLINELTSDEPLTSEKFKTINYLSNVIISEFIKKSYTFGEILNVPSNILDEYNLRTDLIPQFIVTNFPHDFDHSNFKDENGNFDREKYNENLAKYLDNLTLRDRISKLSSYYNKQKFTTRYVFPIEGIIGNSIDFKIGDVHFFSPDNHQIIDSKEVEEFFKFFNFFMNQKDPIFLSVTVEFLTPKSSLQDAIEKIELSFDLISTYFNLSTNLYYNINKFMIIDMNGKIIHWTSGVDVRDPSQVFFNSLNANDYSEELNSISAHDQLAHNISKDSHKLRNALHWYRKAEYSTKYEDKILNYWISIESLFDTNTIGDICKENTKFHLIQEIISSIGIYDYIYKTAWDLYGYYKKKCFFPFLEDNKIPENIIEEAQLRPKKGDKIYLKNFISKINELKTYENNPFYTDIINSLESIINNSDDSLDLISNQISNIKDDLLMIYRLRNLIVHNAHFDSTLLPYYALKAKRLSISLLKKILDEKYDNIDNVLLNLFLKKEKLLDDVKNKKFNF